MQARATLLYEFKESSSERILAQLKLSSLLADTSDVQRLIFTSEGEALFGLGRTYTGTFARHSGTLAADGRGGIKSTAGQTGHGSLFDGEAPASSLQMSFVPFRNVFELYVSDSPGSDSLIFAALGGAQGNITDVHDIWSKGDWQLVVPEPSSGSIAVLALLLTAGRRFQAS